MILAKLILGILMIDLWADALLALKGVDNETD